MRVLLQRVASAQVEVAGQTVGAIGAGLLALVGVTHDDSVDVAQALARKVYGLRILRDERSIADRAAGAATSAKAEEAAVLVVSQFTLYGDARKGRRPTWAAAAPATAAEPLVDTFTATLRDLGATVATGVFGADMRVALVNDGPVTLLLEM